MIVFTQRTQAQKPDSQMPSHLFHVGQSVRIISPIGSAANTSDVCRITATLPPRDGSPQYRIRSDEERHDRVVTQDILEAADSAASGAVGTSLIERTFGHGQETKR